MVIMGHNASLVSGDEEEWEQGGGGRAREEGGAEMGVITALCCPGFVRL